MAPSSATATELAVAFGKLQAHELGCRLRVMEWLDAGHLIVLTAEHFTEVLTLGVIAWPADEETRRWITLHLNIDHARETTPCPTV
jgi:hypothetical protein